jgi:hypothetical protein
MLFEAAVCPPQSMDRLSDKSYWLYTGISLLIGLLLICLIFTVVAPYLQASDSIVNDLRGATIIVIRIPHPPQQIMISENGHAVRAARHASENAPVTRFELTSDVTRDLSHIRTEWCQHPQQFDPLRRGEQFYEVGISCSVFRNQVVVIPVSQLPSILKQLLEAVPASP